MGFEGERELVVGLGKMGLGFLILVGLKLRIAMAFGFGCYRVAKELREEILSTTFIRWPQDNARMDIGSQF